MPTLGALLVYTNSKETQSLAKNSCRQKCLYKILATLFPFTPNSPKNENFKTMTKRPGDIILHMCTPNHMLHCSWDMAVVGCNCYFSFWPIFSPFTLLTAQKMKKKKHLEVSTLTTSVTKIMITCYTVPEIWCARDVIVIIHFGLIFAFLLPPPSP